MYKVLFDIRSEAPQGPEKDSRLFIELGEQHLYLMMAGSAGQAQRVKYFVLDPPMATELPDVVRTILDQESWLREHDQEVIIVYHFPENLLVPAEHFHLEQNRSMLELVNGDLRKGSILSEKIKGLPIFNLFRVPGPIHALVGQNFTSVRYWHFYSLHIEVVLKANAPGGDLLWVTFYSNRLLILALRNGELQSMQSYYYQQAEDAAYYLLKIAQVHQFNMEELPVKVEGLIERDSSMFNELKKYFRDVDFTDFGEPADSPEVFSQFPTHFFSPLQKLVACV